MLTPSADSIEINTCFLLRNNEVHYY